MTRSLVIGASGMVGEHLINALNVLGREAFATHSGTITPSSQLLNITNAEGVNSLIKYINPKIIYLPAALTNVDYCEIHPSEAYEVNVIGVKNVIKAANLTGAKLVYFSTDYIFDGKNGPYDEEATSNPINIYGSQKLEAEHYVALFAVDYLIIRTTVVYGWESRGKNFIYRLVNSLSKGLPVKVPVDQIGSPTYANNLAQISINLAETQLHGVVNIAGPDLVDRYKFAKKAANIFHLDEKLIIPVQTEALNQYAKRPKIAGLLTEKVTGLSTIPVIGYEKGLAIMARENSSI